MTRTVFGKCGDEARSRDDFVVQVFLHRSKVRRSNERFEDFLVALEPVGHVFDPGAAGEVASDRATEGTVEFRSGMAQKAELTGNHATSLRHEPLRRWYGRSDLSASQSHVDDAPRAALDNTRSAFAIVRTAACAEPISPAMCKNPCTNPSISM